MDYDDEYMREHVFRLHSHSKVVVVVVVKLKAIKMLKWDALGSSVVLVSAWFSVLVFVLLFFFCIYETMHLRNWQVLVYNTVSVVVYILISFGL